MPVRHLTVGGALALWLLAFARLIEASEVPMTGTDIASLRPIDRLVTDFMSKYGVPGGAVGFVKDGRLVYIRGFGYADLTTQELVQPDSLFRIASMSKALTAATVLRLVEEGRLKLDQTAFPTLNYSPPTYPGASVDPRLDSITVRQLLNHTGGWDRDSAKDPDGGVGLDPTVNWTVRAARDMGTTAPADAATVVRWMLGKPLQFAPGTQYRYSNFGYTVLGRLIERVTGSNYEKVVQAFLQKAEISRMKIGGSRLAERLPGEVRYYDFPGSSLTTSIFPQDRGPVPWPYNFSYRTMDSHGGWVASAIDVLRFVTAVDGRPSHPNILSSMSISNMIARPCPPWGATQEPYYGMGWQVRNTPDNWWHDGSLPGTRTEMVRAGNGYSWVLLFNMRAERDGEFYAQMDKLGWQAIAAVTTWPTNNLFDAVRSYESWKKKHFTAAELLDRQISGDRADPDGDGVANLVEYASGLDPKKADYSPLVSGSIQTVDGKDAVTVSFRRLLLGQEVSYILERSEDLNRWIPTGQRVGNVRMNDDGTQTVTYREDMAMPASRPHYLRVRFERESE